MQACGDLLPSNPYQAFKVYADYPLAPMLNARATECGLPASTVSLTPPALDTCDGAIIAQITFMT